MGTSIPGHHPARSGDQLPPCGLTGFWLHPIHAIFIELIIFDANL